MAEHLDGDPLATLRRWLDEAADDDPAAPAAMTLATVGDGLPHARTVVVTTITDAGLTFHSSTPTTKSSDLRATPRAAGVFHWPALGRQVVLDGDVTELPAEHSRTAYPSRPRQLQLLAWVYEDLGADPDAISSALAQERMSAAAGRDPATLPMPPSWTTFSLAPRRLDFWQAGSEEVAPTKTRFERRTDGWRRTERLP